MGSLHQNYPRTNAVQKYKFNIPYKCISVHSHHNFTQHKDLNYAVNNPLLQHLTYHPTKAPSQKATSQ